MTAPSPISPSWPLAADPQGHWAAFAEPPHTLVVARLPEQASSSTRRWQTKVQEGIASLSASRDGRWLAVGHQTGSSLALWAPVDDGLSGWIEVSRATLPGATGAVELAFSPTDDTLAVAWGDRLQALRLDLDELSHLRKAAVELSAGSKEFKRVVIFSTNEYARYAALLEAALQQDLKVEGPTGSSAVDDSGSVLGKSIEHADAFVAIVGTDRRLRSEIEMRLAKELGTQIFQVNISQDTEVSDALRDVAVVVNVDARGRVLALGNLHGAALRHAINSAAVNIVSSMGIDATPLVMELQNTYEVVENRYFSPPGEVQSLGRRLSEGDFRALVSQLGPDELLMGLYENQTPALVATHVSSRARLQELSLAHLMLRGYFALPRETANRGWDGGEPVAARTDKRPMIVISYVLTYATLARELVSALEETGRVDVRYDGSISSGESFPATVLQWVDQADALVVLAGPASAHANYSKVELERAQQLGKPVIAVVVEAGALPPTLSSYHAVNVDDHGTPLLLAHLEGRSLEAGLHRVALQVLEAVTQAGRIAPEASLPATSIGNGVESTPDAELSPLEGPGPGIAAASRSLKRGDRGQDVLELQRMLAVEATGVFDAVTADAVGFFQREQNLVPDSVVGPQTWQALVQHVSALSRNDSVVATSPEPERPATVRKGPRAVVSIGVDRVEGLPTLQAAAASAKSFADWATGNQRIPADHVVLITDVEGPVRVRDIQDAVDQCLQIKDLDQLIVFFSGHGAITDQQDVWILTNGLSNWNETVNVNQAADMARSTAVPYIVLISDTARDWSQTGLDGGPTGSAIFPRFKAPQTRICKVDRLFSTGASGRAYEVQSAGSSQQPESVFTSVLLTALSGRESSVIHEYEGHRIATSWSIQRFVGQEMAKRLGQLSVGLHQNPDFIIESDPDRWLASF